MTDTQMQDSSDEFDLVVIGAGPGGYPAAIRAAQLGMSVALVEQADLGGVCLNWGCIPTKALLKSAQILDTISHAADFGIVVGEATPDLNAMIKRSREVVAGMKNGVAHLLKKAGVTVIRGRGRLQSDHTVLVNTPEDACLSVPAKNVIIATGARPTELEALPIDGIRVISSTEAMTQESIPNDLVVVGGGAIGVEFAYFYNQLGSRVTIVEWADRLVPNEDAAVSAELEKSFRNAGMVIITGAEVVASKATNDSVSLELKLASGKTSIAADRVLSAVGVTANTEDLGLEALGVVVERGKIAVEDFYQTAARGVFAIGDVVSGPALAHVATAEAIVCVEHIAGLNPRPVCYTNIPSCIFTQPEIASVGLTETAARESGTAIRVGLFPLAASGKARAMGITDGFVKTIYDEKYGELLGAHMIGPNVTELVAELVVAKNTEATWREIAGSVHPHPTLSEAIMESTANAYGEGIHI